ncbi:MAG: efflux RND transporter periplasmic adaptor subunit [Desulfobacterota bacterium]|nr:efflux RND transporter periplasmic adaptor subunit [Thermodesulfobacteriota bacterium]
MANRRRRKSIFVLAVALIVLGGWGGYQIWGRKEAGQKFRTMRVERGEIRSVVTATGTINPVTTVLVGSQISGTIKALYADFNSLVREGQVIAQIDPAIFEAQVEQGKASLLNAQANLLKAQANLKNAEANLKKAEVAVIDAKRTLDRNRELIEKRVIAQATLEAAETQYETALAQREVARAQLEAARAQVESSKAQVEQARASLKVSETNLRYTTIRSPVNGIVISRNVDVGQTVAASLQAPTLFTIAKDLTQMQVDTNVSEADIGRIAKGQRATFTVDAFPDRTFQGRVSEIRNAPQTIQNVVTYNVVIQVENRDLRLKPGMTANVSIEIEHKENILKVPNAALRFRPESIKRENQSHGASAKSESSLSHSGRSLLERLTRELGLTAEQQSRVEMVLRSAKAEIQEIRERSRPEEAQAHIRALIRQKIWGILTEEQRERMKEMGRSSEKAPARPGRVWVLGKDGKPSPVEILVGITDGTFSEVVKGELEEGTEVVVEEVVARKPKSGTPVPSIKGLR